MSISRAYIIALLIIASSITIGQVIMQRSISNNQLDSYVVNISGRQRMLSQKITKSALLLSNAKDSLTFLQHQADLKSEMHLFRQSHLALQHGDNTMGIPRINNSAIVTKYFEQLSPYFEQMKSGVEGLLIINSFTTNEREKLNGDLQLILNNQEPFLDLMNQITFQYDQEAQEHMNSMARIELMLYAIAILLLIIEAFVIFRPAIRKLRTYTATLVEQEKKLAASQVKKQYIKELEDKNEELKTFSYITSHDLQEPLRTITGFSEILSTNYKEVLDDKGRQMLSYVSESAQKSSDMIRDLLFYTQVGEKGAIEEVDCNQLITEIETSHQKLIEDSHTTIHSSPLPVIQGFKTELKVLFQNLISNAIKYRKPDPPQQIKINYVDKGDHHLFTFTDDGIGIDKNHHQEIFLIFKRVSEDTNHTGTGIGLAMCKKIAQTHGGSIWVASELGKGSIFHVSLPKTLPKEHQNTTTK